MLGSLCFFRPSSSSSLSLTFWLNGYRTVGCNRRGFKKIYVQSYRSIFENIRRSTLETHPLKIPKI